VSISLWAGGGHFRFWPLWLTEWALRQTRSQCNPPVAMLYFSTPGSSTRSRNDAIKVSEFLPHLCGDSSEPDALSDLAGPTTASARAIDIAKHLDQQWDQLSRFDLPTTKGTRDEAPRTKRKLESNLSLAWKGGSNTTEEHTK